MSGEPRLAQPRHLATATAMIESTVMRVKKAEMIRVLHAEPTFAEVFTAHLLTRNSRVEEDLVDQLFNSSEGERQYGGDSLFVFSRAHILSFRGWKGSLSQVKHHRASAVMSNASMAGCNRAVADTIAARCASCAQRREDPYDRAQVTFCGR
jgi:CRP-like cAMP-binding protein